MKRFCLECGHEAEPTDMICTECGTSLEEKVEEEKVQPVKQEKAPMPKKKKIMVGGLSLLVALLIGFYMYGSSYASAESTTKRFHEAVLKKDKSGLKKLVEFENGTKPSSSELDAIIAFGVKEPNEFTKSIGEWGFGLEETSLFALKQTGKVFGVFGGHKLIMPNQFVAVPFPYEELEYTLNGEKVEMEVEGEQAIIGPVAPGIYELNVEYKNEFMEYAESSQVELLSQSSSVASAQLDFDLTSVEFTLDYSDEVNPSKTKLIIGDKEMAFDQDGIINERIPLPLDGSVEVKIASELPWGKVESDGIPVEREYMNIPFNGIGAQTEKDLADIILTYVEESVKTRAVADTKEYTVVTDKWKKVMQESYDNERERNDYYSGQLEEVQVNFERAHTGNENKKPKVIVPVSFSLQEAFDDNGKTPKLKSAMRSCSIEIVYKDEEWKVDRCEGDWFYTEAGGTVLEGSKKLHNASGVKETKEKEEDTEKDKSASKDEDDSKETAAPKDSQFEHGVLEKFMQGYNEASVIAINNNDYSQVSGRVVSDSPRAKEQSDYIVYLNSKSITEDHVGTSLESFKTIDDTTVEVTTKETFNIHYPDKDTAKNTYTTVSQLKLVDGEWKVNKLISTK